MENVVDDVGTVEAGAGFGDAGPHGRRKDEGYAEMAAQRRGIQERLRMLAGAVTRAEDR